MSSANDTHANITLDEAPPPQPGAALAAQPASPPDFSRRAFALPELLDEPCTYATWRAASLDLARLHRLTRGYKPTLGFLERAVAHTGVGCEPLHVVDVGCGHGDGLRTIYRWARRRSLPLRLTGVDLNPYAPRLARERDRQEFIPGGALTWVTGDVFTWQPEQPADLVVSSLFAHHLSDTDIVRFLAWCQAHARIGWFLSDLARSERAARVAAWLTRALRLHPYIQHDTPASFRRALSLADWQHRLAEAHIGGVLLQPGRGKLFLEHFAATGTSGRSGLQPLKLERGGKGLSP